MALRDFDRGLNARGRKGAALMGAHITDYGAAWSMVLASPAERVRLTLDASGLDIPVTFDQRAYLADSAALLDLLRGANDSEPAMLLVGHNPGLHDLAVEIAAPDDDNGLLAKIEAKFPTAAFAVLELAIERWQDLDAGCGRLVHFARPRDIDPELGPER